jgi:CTP:molybdopterin cytidylyltransferase MocA
MRRGHPWLISRRQWRDFLDLKPPFTPRDFLYAHSKEIHHVEVNTPGILADLDTLQDYNNFKP